MDKKLIGIDIGGTTIKIGLLEDDGTIIKKWEIPTRIENKGANILSDINESIRTEVQELGLAMDDFHAAGVGVPGPVKLTEGFLPIAVNLGGFGDVNINKELGALLEMPVVTDNDANVAALGEKWLGSGKGNDHVIMYTLGTGVGGGIITNGEVITGARGTGGEIGHMPIVPETDFVYTDCNCGAKGCLETVCSATGIVRIARLLLQEGKLASTLRNDESLSAEAVFTAAKAGDGVGVAVVDIFGKYLAKSMELLAVTVNPAVFILGGGVSQAGDILLTAVQKHFGTNIFPAAIEDVEIHFATLGNDAGIIGSANHAKTLSK